MDHKGFSRGNGGDILDKSNLVKMRNGIVVGFVTQTSIYTRKNKKSFRCKHTNIENIYEILLYILQNRLCNSPINSRKSEKRTSQNRRPHT